jgi:hypothetical protein
MAKKITLEDAMDYGTVVNGESIKLSELTKEQLILACAEQMEVINAIQNIFDAGTNFIDEYMDADIGTMELLEDEDETES